ncbi:MAG: hypothetical protein Q7U53_19445 [Anaerolineaceae bacterium]|nr:hypothetical protein [Anaerolineaceae bacterium]
METVGSSLLSCSGERSEEPIVRAGQPPLTGNLIVRFNTLLSGWSAPEMVNVGGTTGQFRPSLNQGRVYFLQEVIC